MTNRKIRGPGRCAGARTFMLVLAVMAVQNAVCPGLVWAAAETITYEGPVFTENEEDFRPKETLEQGGKQYRLISSRIKSAVREGTLTYASASIPYALEGNQEPPDTAMITLKDETTGKEYEREVPRQEIRQKDSFWTDDFRFQITVNGYDSSTFYLGETEIPSDSDLSSYGEEFLNYLGLPADCYHVEEVVWSGESYEEDGVLCRNAEARGSKLIRNVDVKYGGQVRTPEIKGKQYIGIYEEIVPETDGEEKRTEEPETGESQEKEPELPLYGEVSPSEANAIEKILYWIRDHLTVVTVSAGFLLLMLAAAVLLWLSVKKGKSRDC